MLHVHPVQSLDLPALAPYRTMKRQADQLRENIFVAEGEKVVRRLLESPLTVVSLLLPQKWVEHLRPILESRPEEIHAYVAEKKLLEQMTGYSMYQGVLAVGKAPASLSIEEALHASAPPRLLVAVDALANAENLGALVRNCGAFGVQSLIVGETSSSPYLRRAVRSSMGVVFQLPVVESSDLAGTLRWLRSRDVYCVAAHPHTDRHAVMESSLDRDCCIVFGSEGQGISPAVLEACDDAVAIPMTPAVDSLNVASASAVFLYEAQRQRTAPRRTSGEFQR